MGRTEPRAPIRSPYKDFPAFFEYLNAAIFGTDTVLSFFRSALVNERYVATPALLDPMEHLCRSCASDIGFLCLTARTA